MNEAVEYAVRQTVSRMLLDVDADTVARVRAAIARVSASISVASGSSWPRRCRSPRAKSEGGLPMNDRGAISRALWSTKVTCRIDAPIVRAPSAVRCRDFSAARW